MRIGILETGLVPDDLRDGHGDFTQMFETLISSEAPDMQFETVSVISGEMPKSTTDADAWLITGSKHGVYDDLPWMEPLGEFLRSAAEQRVPMIGVCFGHQMLAQALGGRVEKSSKGWGCGLTEYRRIDDAAWFGDTAPTIRSRAMHQDQVVVAPTEARLLASTEFCPNAAFAYGSVDAPYAISIQPHPEFTADFHRELIASRKGTLIATDVAEAAIHSLAVPADTKELSRWFVRFLRGPSGKAAA